MVDAYVGDRAILLFFTENIGRNGLIIGNGIPPARFANLFRWLQVSKFKSVDYE